ncbi:glutathione S-transferase family protein [Pseudomonas typographi]|uniref:glutathione S-transferase family protein n=1 Tax=Pseudomonas typographi TaxID=2715964 RepID=UPI0016894AE8|nr:glutathione S-transferase family protein [Pseudomonas typographi]MBD1550989.1 glutathione S-transferase family protein [Pseudomonas typographi]
MNELILHHYPASPYAEKARLMLGFKGLSWRSVIIPPMMPKPDLTALTGGYRKTPVLQLGADIYCDTALIARRIDAEKALPALFPAALDALVSAFGAWAGQVVFPRAVAWVFQPESAAVRFARFNDEQRQAFLADRAKLFSGGTAQRQALEQVRQEWPALMGRLEHQIAHAKGDYLFGAATYADFALAHCLWFLKGTPVTAPLVDAYPETAAWLGRVLGFGHGAPSELASADAIEIAKAAAPAALPEGANEDPNGLKLGAEVQVAATDYGVEPVLGELVYSGTYEVIIKRVDERAGTVHVHFPRLGFAVARA